MGVGIGCIGDQGPFCSLDGHKLLVDEDQYYLAPSAAALQTRTPAQHPAHHSHNQASSSQMPAEPLAGDRLLHMSTDCRSQIVLLQTLADAPTRVSLTEHATPLVTAMSHMRLVKRVVLSSVPWSHVFGSGVVGSPQRAAPTCPALMQVPPKLFAAQLPQAVQHGWPAPLQPFPPLARP